MNSQPPKPDINQGKTYKQLPHRIILDSILVAAGLLFFAVTSPQRTPSLLLLAGFLVIAVILTAVFDGILQLSGIAGRLRPDKRRGLYIIVAIIPVILLLLQSLGQLSGRDAAVIILVTFIGSFYVSAIRRYQQ